MSSLARETGARAFVIRRFEELPALFAQIAVELRHQYLLGYTAPVATSGESGFRVIDVTVPHVSGAHARTRRGYYASPGLPAAKPTPPSHGCTVGRGAVPRRWTGPPTSQEDRRWRDGAVRRAPLAHQTKVP
jgi:hypothetical protein